MTYRKQIAQTIFLTLICISPVFSQRMMFEYVTDARLASLGDNASGGFVDGYSLPLQSSYSLGRRITEVSYGSRVPIALRNLDTRSWHTSLFVPIDEKQTLTLFYHRLDWPTLYGTTAQDPEAPYEVKPYELIVGGAYNRALIRGFSCNIAVKYYYYGLSPTAKAYVADIGFSYFHNLFDFERFRGSISLGTSITNLGTRIKIENINTPYVIETSPIMRSIYFCATYNQEFLSLTRWYKMNCLIAFRYRNVLNARSYWEGRDYWSLGMELGYADIIFLRAGLSILPFSSMYGNDHQGAASYGLGIKVPFEELSSVLNLFSLKFDYAAIPLNTEILRDLFGIRDIKHDQIYTVRLGYDFSLSEIF